VLTPLGWALNNRAAAVVDVLLEFRADPNERCAHYHVSGAQPTPLLYAVWCQCARAIPRLLAAGADPHITSTIKGRAMTPEQYAQSRGGSSPQTWSDAITAHVRISVDCYSCALSLSLSV
jgi:hypothetical protein